MVASTIALVEEVLHNLTHVCSMWHLPPALHCIASFARLREPFGFVRNFPAPLAARGENPAILMHALPTVVASYQGLVRSIVVYLNSPRYGDPAPRPAPPRCRMLQGHRLCSRLMILYSLQVCHTQTVCHLHKLQGRDSGSLFTLLFLDKGPHTERYMGKLRDSFKSQCP